MGAEKTLEVIESALRVVNDEFRGMCDKKIIFVREVGAIYENAFLGSDNLCLVFTKGVMEVYERTFFGCSNITVVTDDEKPIKSLEYLPNITLEYGENSSYRNKKRHFDAMPDEIRKIY